MTIILDHTIVPAHDKKASAHLFAALLGLTPGEADGPFVPVAVNPELTLDFDDRHAFEPHHYAFLVDDVTFERAVHELRARGLRIGSAPENGWDGKVHRTDRGQRVYFCDDNAHSFELFTSASL